MSEVGVLGDPTTATAAARASVFRDGRRLRHPGTALDPRRRRDVAMTQPRLPDGFAVQVDRHVRVLGDGGALLGGSPTRLLRLAPSARTLLDNGRLEVNDAVTAQLARTLLDATVAHPRPSGGPSHRDVTVVIPVYDNVFGLQRLMSALRGLRVVVVDDGSAIPVRQQELQRASCPGRGDPARATQERRRRRPQHRPGGVHDRLRRVPGRRCRAAARLARGAAWPFLQTRRWRSSHRGS